MITIKKKAIEDVLKNDDCRVKESPFFTDSSDDLNELRVWVL